MESEFQGDIAEIDQLRNAGADKLNAAQRIGGGATPAGCCGGDGRAGGDKAAHGGGGEAHIVGDDQLGLAIARRIGRVARPDRNPRYQFLLSSVTTVGMTA